MKVLKKYWVSLVQTNGKLIIQALIVHILKLISIRSIKFSFQETITNVYETTVQQTTADVKYVPTLEVLADRHINSNTQIQIIPNYRYIC